MFTIPWRRLLKSRLDCVDLILANSHILAIAQLFVAS